VLSNQHPKVSSARPSSPSTRPPSRFPSRTHLYQNLLDESKDSGRKSERVLEGEDLQAKAKREEGSASTGLLPFLRVCLLVKLAHFEDGVLHLGCLAERRWMGRLPTVLARSRKKGEGKGGREGV